ncbi:hypothetical protein QQ045_017533 [Rhodiola kirilowii]
MPPIRRRCRRCSFKLYVYNPNKASEVPPVIVSTSTKYPYKTVSTSSCGQYPSLTPSLVSSIRVGHVQPAADEDSASEDTAKEDTPVEDAPVQSEQFHDEDSPVGPANGKASEEHGVEKGYD